VRARYKIADFLRLRQEGLTALLVFAGDSFTVTPLTDDVATIASQLNALDPEIMPVQGNRAELAVQMAVDLMRQAGATNGDILLISDEIEGAQAQDAVRDAKDQGYRVSVLGIGTESGVPLPLKEGGFLKDDSGRIVVPVLDETALREVAAAGDGIYVRMSQDDQDVTTLQQYFSKLPMKEELAATELETDLWREEGPWLLLPLLPLVALIFRRGYLAVLVLFLLPLPRQVQALEWQDLWLRKDQQAAQRFSDGEHKDAAALFSDPAWRGTAQYRTGDYEAAAQTLDTTMDPESRYNRGNALARLGRYPEAIAEYEKVLKELPDHADAIHNKELVEKELQQQQQSSGDQGQDKNQQDKQDPQQEADKSEQQPGEQDQSSPDPQQSGDQQQQQQAGQQQDKPEQQSESGEQDQPQDPEQQPMASQDDQTPDEQQQAAEQWLRRIPDDPGGLLRRKFKYQYQQRAVEPAPGSKSW